MGRQLIFQTSDVVDEKDVEVAILMFFSIVQIWL